MSNKLFILGWDNALVSDVTENIHASYLSMLEKFCPHLAARWTFDNTGSMQGMHPDKVWESFIPLLGAEKTNQAREFFYEDYRSRPLPPLTKSATEFLRELKARECTAVVVSNKTQSILEEEARLREVDGLVDFFIGTVSGKEKDCVSSTGDDLRFHCRLKQLKQAMEICPDAKEVTVIAGIGYAEPALTLGVTRFEEASAQVFDWVADEIEKIAPHVIDYWGWDDFL